MASLSSFCGSSTSFRAAAGIRQRQQTAARGVTGSQMRKQGIHPEWYPEARVFCNGVEVMTVGGTKESYNVDIYSGNHPFYTQGAASVMIVDDGQLNKFKKRFAGLEELATVSAAAASGPAPKEEKKGAAGKGGKKGGAKRR